MSCASSRPVGSGAEHQRAGARAEVEGLESVHGAGGGLREDCSVEWEPVHREDEHGGHRHVLGEEAGKVAAEPLGVGTQDQPSGQAVVACAAIDVRVDRDVLADSEALDVVAELVDDANELVTGYQREHGVEVAVVDVQVSAADPHLLHPDPHLARPHFGFRDIGHGKAPRGVIQNCLHRRSLSVLHRLGRRRRRPPDIVGRAAGDVRVSSWTCRCTC